VITVVLTEFVPTVWWHHILHNHPALFIKGILLFEKGVVSTGVPFHLWKEVVCISNARVIAGHAAPAVENNNVILQNSPTQLHGGSSWRTK
jgi:hypothetical protein